MRTHRTEGAVALMLAMTLAACGDDSTPSGDGGDAGTTGAINLDEGGIKLDQGGGSADVTGANPDTLTSGGCGEVSVTVTPTTPTLVLLVDQSGSMTDDFGPTDRWQALYDTLMDPMDGVVINLEGTIRFGLTLYTSENGNDGPTCPMLQSVPPSLNNYAAIDAVYAPEQPNDETPTGESLAEVALDLAAFAEPGPKGIVLATDGQPDTCAEPNPQNGEPESLQAAQDAYAMGIETFILSVGPDVAQDHLQEMANVGKGLDPNDMNPAPYWQALDPQQLVDAFNEIVGSFVSCNLAVDGIVDLDTYCEGTVLLDGQMLVCDTDWTMLDESTVQLLGAACETLQDGGEHSVAASWPCDSVVIP
jgi:hypothetical protein